MLYHKKDFPEEDELVLCTVTNVQHNSVFVHLDEYDRGGMIHISEVSPGRIRNIRDFVVEGKKIVCKVLRINKERGYIDLSLRRVNDMQKKLKINFIKQEQKAEKILELVSKKLKLDLKELYNDVMSKISKDYDSLHDFFEDIVAGDSELKEYDIDKKIEKDLNEAIFQRIKPAKVELKGEFFLQSRASNGIEIIKAALAKAQENNSVYIRYKGSGKYSIKVTASDYKKGEKVMEKATESVLRYMEKQKEIATYTRIE